MAKNLLNIGIDLNILKADINQIIENLNIFDNMISYKVTRTIATLGVDLMSKSQPRVPVDSGKLRRSGRARLIINGRGRIVGWGNKLGSVRADLGWVTPSRARNAKRIGINVSYHRMGTTPKGTQLDVALWTHENLNPYDMEMSPRARTVGTGPKYLEIPYLENRDRYIRILKDILKPNSIKKDIKVLASRSAIKRRGRGRYTVNSVKFVRSNIERVGYYG